MEIKTINDAMIPLQYVNADGEIVTLDTKKMLDLDNVNPNELANDYFLVSRLESRQELEAKDLANQLEALRSELYLAYTNDETLKRLNNNKKPTESMISSAINTTNNYRQLLAKKQATDYQVTVLKWLCKALEMKSSIFQTKSANERASRGI